MNYSPSNSPRTFLSSTHFPRWAMKVGVLWWQVQLHWSPILQLPAETDSALKSSQVWPASWLSPFKLAYVNESGDPSQVRLTWTLTALTTHGKLDIVTPKSTERARLAALSVLPTGFIVQNLTTAQSCSHFRLLTLNKRRFAELIWHANLENVMTNSKEEVESSKSCVPYAILGNIVFRVKPLWAAPWAWKTNTQNARHGAIRGWQGLCRPGTHGQSSVQFCMMMRHWTNPWKRNDIVLPSSWGCCSSAARTRRTWRTCDSAIELFGCASGRKWVVTFFFRSYWHIVCVLFWRRPFVLLKFRTSNLFLEWNFNLKH